MEYKTILNQFLPFADVLNNSNIKWAIGGSLLLALEGYNTDVHDVDILIASEHEATLLNILKNYTYTTKDPNELYVTKRFFHVEYNNIDIDLLINFKIKTASGIYSFPFTKDTPVKKVKYQQTTLCLSSTSEWYNAYIHMDRGAKIKIIDDGPLND